MRVCKTTALTARGHGRLGRRFYSLQIPNTARYAAGEVGPRIGADTTKHSLHIQVTAWIGHRTCGTSVTTAGGSSTGN